MKKHVSILLGLMVIFSSLFTSCNNEDELDPNICKITVNSEGNGTVSITDYIGTSVNVLIGNQVEVVATPDDGWAFTGWYANGTETPISTDAAFTFTTSESVTLTARFAKLSDIIIRSGGNGRVAFKGATGNSIPVVPGTEVTVIATPNENYYFVGWFVGDSETPISTEKVYTFTATENIILTGQFSKRPIVTVRSTGNGNATIKDADGVCKAFLPDTEVTVIATTYKNCNFIGWYITDEESPVSLDAEYTFTVTENIVLTAKFNLPTVEAIDLGLSVKWASFNVGASTPEEFGGYYAWGETEEKNKYDFKTYNLYSNIYNKPIEDVAHMKWGGNWRIPTKNELEELLEKCTWTWTTQNGVIGYKITGSNGNSLFLPAAGGRDDTEFIHIGSECFYWSSSRYEGNSAWILYTSTLGMAGYQYGFCIRPVCE